MAEAEAEAEDGGDLIAGDGDGAMTGEDVGDGGYGSGGGPDDMCD
jgi:hypothetical protein